MYITEAEKINAMIEAGAPLTAEKQLELLIKEDQASKVKKEMAEGEDYYKGDHEILKRKIQYYSDENTLEEDKDAANNKLVHAFHKILVDQKVAYITGDPIKVTTEDEQFQKEIDARLGEKFEALCPVWVKGASNKGVDWLHIFINEKQEFDYVIISAMEVIPFYDTTYQRDLESLIRYYPLVIYEAGEAKERIRAEWWNKETVKYYMQDKEGKFYFEDEKPHWSVSNSNDPESKALRSWGKVPFIPLANNDEEITDLKVVKSLIDAFDKCQSDFSNNLEDIPDAIWKLAGYGGEDLKQFRKDLKVFKAIKLEEGGTADADRMDIPKDARESHSKSLKESIFMFGMGVDPTNAIFGNSPSGIALKFLYILLDLKASMLIRKMKLALREFMWFIVKSLDVKSLEENSNPKFDYKAVEFTFNLSILVNETEQIQNVQASADILSVKTRLKNHTWVDDVDAELKQIKTEKAEDDSIDLTDNEEDSAIIDAMQNNMRKAV